LPGASAPKITPRGSSDQNYGRACPITREQFETAETELLKDGGRNKADLRVMRFGEGSVVIKDFGRKAWWVRWIGRVQIAREYKAYRWLGSMRGVPRLVGRIDRFALAVQRVDGRQLGFATDLHAAGAAVYQRLRAVVDEMHRRGLLHLDLRGRENILVGGDGEIHIVDFASALWFRPGGLLHRLFFSRMQRVDLSAMLKWKRTLNAGPLTEQEQSFLDRFNYWRSFWIFNPKRRDPDGR
jgi:serine/threonine protein kinase